MKVHTKEFKENIKKFGRELDSQITYTLNNEEVVLGKEQLNAITPHYEGDILKSVMKQLDIDSNVDIPVGTEVNYQFGVLVNNNYEYLDYGNYIVYSTEKQEDTRSYKIVCYDKMLYAMKDYERIDNVNLFEYPYENTTKTQNGITFTDNGDGSITINGTATAQAIFYINGGGWSFNTNQIIEKGTYTFNRIYNNANVYLCTNLYDENSTPTFISSANNNATFNVDKIQSINSTRIVVTSGTTVNNLKVYPQLELGNTTTKFRPYFEYPTTLKNYLWNICSKIGLDFKSTNFVNYDKEITNELYLDSDGNSLNYTYRDVLDEIAGATASTICINDDDELEVRYITDTEDLIDEEYLKDINVNFGEKYGPVNSIVFSRSAESDNIYKKDVDSITENGLTEIKIKDNQILNSNNRFDFIDGIFNQLNGFEYYANDFSSTGVAYYDLCDRYNIRVDNNIYSCIMMNDELDVTQGLEEKVHLDIPEKSETDYKKADTTDRRINQAWLIVNKQEQTIEGLVSKTQELEDGTYTKEQVDNLIIDAKTGFTNTFSEAGGNNILRNTGLWFESGDSDNPYEFWNGKVVRVKEDNAVNLNALSLQNTTLTQQQNVSNGMYTISFKYKRKIATANATMMLNGIGGVSLLGSDEIDKEAEAMFNIELNTQYIDIGFVCDVDDGFYIYDLMLNSGKIKLAYSQNQNETTTDTVNISKGITITSSDTKTIFKADSTGIKTLDENGNRLTEFTDTGMVTKEATIENKSQIVGTLWQEVNNQTWITKL